MNPLDEIKPHIVAFLHDDRIRKHKELIKNKHGREATESEVSALITIMVASTDIDKEANEICKKLFEKIKKLLRPKYILLNSAISLPILGLLGLTIYVILNGKLPDGIAAGSYAQLTAFITAIVMFGVVLVSYLKSFDEKGK